MAAKIEDQAQTGNIFDPAFLQDIFSVLTSSKNVGVVKPAPIVVVNAGGNGSGAQDTQQQPQASQSRPGVGGMLGSMMGVANQKVKPAEQTASDAQPVTGMPDLWSGILQQMGQWAQPQPGAQEQQQTDQKSSGGKGKKKESNGLGNLADIVSGTSSGGSGIEKSIAAITKLIAMLG